MAGGRVVKVKDTPHVKGLGEKEEGDLVKRSAADAGGIPQHVLGSCRGMRERPATTGKQTSFGREACY